MNDAQVQAQSCATPANDEPVGVARTNAMLKQGDTFCVFELGSVPEGTKLYTRPQPAKVTPAIDERAEFEKWYKSHIVTGLDLESFREGAAYKYTEGDRLNIAYEAWQARAKLSAPVVPDELKEICGLIARIFFYGNFVAKTYNERELEKLLRKNGYFAESEDELMEIIQRLPSRNA